MRTLKRELLELHQEGDETKKAALVKHFGETLTEIVMPDPDQVETEEMRKRLEVLFGKLIVRLSQKGVGGVMNSLQGDFLGLFLI